MGFWDWITDFFVWVRRIICLIRSWFVPEEQSEDITECTYGWRSAYHARLPGDCRLVVTVRIKLNPDADVTAAELANLQTTWEQGIENRWSNRFALGTASGACSCRNLNVAFDVQWVTSGEHHTVRVRRGPARSNMTTWDTADNAGAASHEFGHMLGYPDEYADANCPNRTVSNDGSIMDENTGNPQRRHYQRIADWVSRKTCCTYTVN